MWFLESWWQRTPCYLRIALTLITILALALGGSADHYWT
jgi:hypothetical protein